MKINRFHKLKTWVSLCVFSIILGTALFSCSKSDSIFQPYGFLSKGQTVSISFKYNGQQFQSFTDDGWARYIDYQDFYEKDVISLKAYGQYGYSVSAKFENIYEPKGNHNITGIYGSYFNFNAGNNSLYMNYEYPESYINLNVSDLAWVSRNFYSINATFSGSLYNPLYNQWFTITEGVILGGEPDYY